MANPKARDLFGNNASTVTRVDAMMATRGVTNNAFEAFRAVDTQPDVAPNSIDVTDFTDKNFHVDTSLVQADSVAMAGAQEVDVSQRETALNGVEADYMNTDALIRNTFMDAVQELYGAEMRTNMEAQFAPPETGKMSAASAMADPTGGMVGGAIAIMNEVHAANKNVPPDILSEVISTTLGKVQEQERYQQMSAQEQAASGPPPLQTKIPDGISFADKTAAQMQSFMERDTSNDAVMLQVEQARIGIDAVKRENAVINGQDHVLGDQTAKAMYAADHGDMAGVEEHTGGDLIDTVEITHGVDEGEAHVILAEQGVDIDIDPAYVHDSARASLMYGGYQDLGLPVDRDSIIVPTEISALLDNKNAETPDAPAYHREPEQPQVQMGMMA